MHAHGDVDAPWTAPRVAVPPGRIIIIGDSHIGLSERAEPRIVSWLDRLESMAPSALYLNGDLFHYLIAHRKFFTPTVGRVFERFARLRDSGVAVHYVEGNRDFFIRGSFAEEAVSDVALEYVFDAGDRKYLIVHGDMINDRDYQYRFWRFISKSPVSRLGIEMIPARTARSFVDMVEKRLSGTNFKHKSVLPMALMREYAARRAESGVTDVVFGHFHEKVVDDAAPARITILPPWFEAGEAMVIDPATGEAGFATI